MGFLRRVFNDGLTGQQGRRQHDVDGRAHGRHIQTDPTAVESLLTGGQSDIFFRLINVCAQRQKAFDMLVDRPPPQVTAPGQRDLRPAEAAQQGPHQIIAGSDLPGQLIGDLTVPNVGTVDLHRGAVDGAHVRPQLPEDLEDQGHIADLGNIFNAADPVHQQGGGDDGDSGVLGSADLNGSMERMSALNQIFGQSCTLFKRNEVLMSIRQNAISSPNRSRL